jgi:hypothetical protein
MSSRQTGGSRNDQMQRRHAPHVKSQATETRARLPPRCFSIWIEVNTTNDFATAVLAQEVLVFVIGITAHDYRRR